MVLSWLWGLQVRVLESTAGHMVTGSDAGAGYEAQVQALQVRYDRSARVVVGCLGGQCDGGLMEVVRRLGCVW